MESAYRDWLINALGGDAPWPPTGGRASDTTIADLLDAAHAEGVAVAIFYALRRRPCWQALPEALQAGLTHAAKQGIAWDIASQAEVIRALQAIAAAGIDALLLKGAALAHLLYPEPQCRPRGDTDLLVADRQTADCVHALLQPLGYTKHLGVEGRYISHQFACTRPGPLGIAITLDIHWRLSNANLLAQRLTFADLWAERRPLPALGPTAFAPSPHHVLMHALFHRAWHLGEGDPDRLIWLYDIHLLCESFAAKDWTRFIEEVNRCRLQPLCRDGLGDIASAFGTAIPDDVDRALSAASPRGPLSQLQIKRPGLRRKLVDLLSLPTWPQRLAWLREYAFPDVAYMQHRFGADTRWRLFTAYIRRALRAGSSGGRGDDP